MRSSLLWILSYGLLFTASLTLMSGCESIDNAVGSIPNFFQPSSTPSPELLPTFTPTIGSKYIYPNTEITPTPNLTLPPCNHVSPGTPLDLSISDGTRLRPGEPFTKTWRLINSGSCTWSREYTVVFFSGTSLTQVHSQNLYNPVQPGLSVDISIDMIAPNRPGIYQSNWKLHSDDGSLFGIGPAGSAPFWVRIEVVDNRTMTPTKAPYTPTPTPMEATTSKITLKVNEDVDLDVGDQKDFKQKDVSFTMISSENHLLSPENGARLAVFGENFPTIKDCLALEMSEAPLKLETLKEGIYLCYRTSESKPGYARLTDFQPESNTINLDFFTWNIPDLNLATQEPQKTP